MLIITVPSPAVTARCPRRSRQPPCPKGLREAHPGRRGHAARLERFLGDPETGIFRGPFLRIRTPFHPADDGGRAALEWQPSFTPWRHQAKAWQRLSTYKGTAEPTLVTTGTGSGKTESFLIPVLDHCRRQKALGRCGVKAVLLYPMNALATDQAGRIGDYWT